MEAVLPKEALCYQCALRMSILYQYAAPLSLSQLTEARRVASPRNTSENVEADPDCPTLDDSHHPRFTIVHETAHSVRRFFRGRRDSAGVAAKPDGHKTAGSTADGMLAGEDAPRHDVTWLCVGCLGLYQFIDLVFAPSIAAEVRCSRFTDSKGISINVNVNRSFTFTWLAAASRYYDNKGTMTERPKPTAVITEELCNFKEFYMSDLRARVLQYLLHPHEEVCSARRSHLVGFETYLNGVHSDLATVKPTTPSADPPSHKQRRLESGDDGDRGLTPPASQGFTYSPINESVIVDAYCRHHPTESLVTGGRLPAQYCSNRSGGVLNYSVIYDHALPYLESIGWTPLPGQDKRRELREAATLSTGVAHANIYLIGNYCKMQRNLSQSPWFTNGARIGTFSLQEIIANPVLPFFFPEGVTSLAPPACATEDGKGEEGYRATLPRRTGGVASAWQDVHPALISAELVFGYGRYKFHSAGREDVDVRMLGSGRPFVLEIISPSREQISEDDLRRLEADINESENGSVEVSQLRLTDAEITVRLARHSESKVKRYRCVIWCSREIPRPEEDPHFVAVQQMKDVTIEQKTPLRVLHRRSLHARPRVIHSMKLTPLNAHWFLLEVETQAGTYVKEFVHGDLGRTMPSLGTLLNARTDIIQLDVVGMTEQDLNAAPATA